MRAVGKYLVLKKVEFVKTGLIELPTDPQRPESLVLSVGEDVKLPVKVGDKVVHNGGRAVKLDGDEYVIVKDEEVLAVSQEA